MPLSVKDGMSAWIDDFKKSDAPQFKGKSDKERREMAIAAYMSAKKGNKNEATDKPPFDPDPPKPAAKNSDGSKTTAMSRAKQLAKKARDAQKNEAVTYHGNPNKDDDARNAARRKRLAKQDNVMKKRAQDNEKARQALKDPDHNPAWANSKSKTEASVVPSADGKSLVSMKKRPEPKEKPVPNSQFGLPRLQKTNEISQDLKKRYTDKAKSDYGHQQFSADIAREMGAKDAEKYHRRKQRNRMAGITKATREHVEQIDEVGRMSPKVGKASYTAPAKELKAYAQKSGGIDKKDFMQVADMLEKLDRINILQAGQLLGQLNAKLKNMDTSPREKILSVLHKHGHNVGNVMPGTKMRRESVEQLDELSPATHDRYQKAAHKSAVQGVAQMRMGTRTPKSMAANQKKRQAGIDTSKFLNRKQHGVKPTYEAKSFDQKFRDHLKFSTSKSPAVQAYLKKRVADRDAMNKKNDPNAAKKGYALSAVPPERAFGKARKKGMSASDASQAVGTASRNRGRKLPK